MRVVQLSGSDIDLQEPYLIFLCQKTAKTPQKRGFLDSLRGEKVILYLGGIFSERNFETDVSAIGDMEEMYKLYSRRTREMKGEPEVYQYDEIPAEFRTQLKYILGDLLNEKMVHEGFLWDMLYVDYARETGLKELEYDNRDWILHELNEGGKKIIEDQIDKADTEGLLNLIDFAFHFIENNPHEIPPYIEEDTRISTSKAIEELNERFQQHSLGYEYVGGMLNRIDNKEIHKNVIKPALCLLNEEGFEGADEEFRNAFEKKKMRDNKNAILEAEKAFESTMKTICDKLHFEYDAKKQGNASRLIKILSNNGFFPEYMVNHMNNLITVMESGAPTIRNRNSGHGQGSNANDVPDELVEFTIDLVASNIVFLVSTYKKKKDSLTIGS